MKIVAIMLIGGIIFLICNALNFKFNIYSRVFGKKNFEKPKVKKTIEKTNIQKSTETIAKNINESIIVDSPFSNISNTDETKPKKKKKKVK